MERVVVIAKLRGGAAAAADKILAKGPPFDPGESGFDRHAVFRAGDEVVFMFEGEAADSSVRELVNDPVRSAAFGAWSPLLDGVPKLAHEVYYWRRSGR